MRLYLPHLLFASSLAFGSESLTTTSALRTLYEFPNETWVENLAQRSNGKILVTLIDTPELWQIDTSTTPATAELIFAFPAVASVMGITEYNTDVFAVNVGNWTISSGHGAKGACSVWSINMGDAKPNVRKIVDIPDAVFLNGLTHLPANPSILLSADSARGKIYSIDTTSSQYMVAISDSTLEANASAPFKLGVNGVQFRPNEPDRLYFSNSFHSPIMSSMPISSHKGVQVGPAEPIFTNADVPFNQGVGVDDFTFSTDGMELWMTTDPYNSILRASRNKVGKWMAEIAVGTVESALVAGPTGAEFDRVRKGQLYITTNGGIANPPTTGVIGGKLLVFDTGL